MTSHQGPPDGATAHGSVDAFSSLTGNNDGSSIDAPVQTLPQACGGTVAVSGSVLQGAGGDQPFTAGYVYAGYTAGCDSISLIIADRQTNPTTSLTVLLTAVPGTSTLVGSTTPAVTLRTTDLDSVAEICIAATGTSDPQTVYVGTTDGRVYRATGA